MARNHLKRIHLYLREGQFSKVIPMTDDSIVILPSNAMTAAHGTNAALS
jgi:hypothetical protein